MVKFRIACHVITWGTLSREHLESVFRQIAEAGYEGVEGVWFNSAEDLIEGAAVARAWGLQIVMAHARTSHQIIRYNAALGNRACEIWEGPIEDFGPPEVTHKERFPLVARFFEPLIAEAAHFGIQLYHHIHLGQLVVTNDHVDLLVRHLPNMGILLDTGHLTAAGGDVMRVIRDHAKRIAHVHLKDFWQGPGWNYKHPDYLSESYFAPLGQGNAGLDMAAVLKALDEIGYSGWVSCELDPLPALMKKGLSVSELIRQNREYLRSLGY